jgi:hypothetical protein
MKGSGKLFRVLLVLVGCGILACGEQAEELTREAKGRLQGAERGRIRAVLIVPKNPTPMTDLEAEVVFGGNDPERVSYQWLRNAAPIPGAIGPKLSGHHLNRGDFVAVEVAARYPGGGMDRSVSMTVVIGNTPPIVTRVVLEPDPATSSDTLRAVVAGGDQDGDHLGVIYEWTVDDETIIGQEGPSLASRYFRRGNRVRVAATPFDGVDRGKTKRSGVVVILNSAPRIVSDPPERAEKGVYRYVVQAEDPDGDPLRFFLQGRSPTGMEVDSETGVVHWQVVAHERPVTYTFKVVAQDPAGAMSVQEITMSAGPPTGQPS